MRVWLKIRDDVGTGNVWADLIYTACLFIYTVFQGLWVKWTDPEQNEIDIR